MATRLFISFDYDNDEDLRTLLVGQAKNKDSPFEIADWSVKKAFTESNWEAKVRTRIRQVGQVAVICGNKTDKASCQTHGAVSLFPTHSQRLRLRIRGVVRLSSSAPSEG